MGNNRAALYCRVDGGGDRETYQWALSAQRGRLEAFAREHFAARSARNCSEGRFASLRPAMDSASPRPEARYPAGGSASSNPAERHSAGGSASPRLEEHYPAADSAGAHSAADLENRNAHLPFWHLPGMDRKCRLYGLDRVSRCFPSYNIPPLYSVIAPPL